ncbi:MAG: hypothetical protein V4813_18980 [Gemmatimonadota bacterium]
MQHRRSGTSLCEVLLALVLISATVSWALRSAAVTERSFGHARARQAALQRAALALEVLQAVPCDSSVAYLSVEARWQVQATRTRTGQRRSDRVTILSRRGDTLAVQRDTWCDR